MMDESNLKTRLPPRVEEQRLYDIACDLPGENIMAVSTGRAQASEQLAKDRPGSQVTCWYMDGHFHSLASQHVDPLPNLDLTLSEDWPRVECDLALVPLPARGETELSRDLLQVAFDRLEIGGTLVASVDKTKDHWLSQQLGQFEKSIKVKTFDDATVCMIEKKSPLKKLRDFRCELKFRDLDRLIKIVTRPGVFSHRELDNGARQLLDAVDVFPEARIIDIGCGSGAVALGLAVRDPSAKIHAIDSNARAIWCTQQGGMLNEISNLTVELNASGVLATRDSFDMALANPPYFADFRIAELFIEAATRCLRPGGRLVLVMKQPRWYEENLPRWLEESEVYQSRRYWIASGIRK